jgi:hypothetical protein
VITRDRARRISIAALGAVTVVAIIVRVPSIVEPLGIDQGLWASAARAMSRGQLLYRDVWDQKPPGIFLLYLAAFRTIGWTRATVGALDIGAAAVTAVLLFLIASRVGRVVAGATASAVYAVLTVPSWQFRYGGILNRSVAETFIGVFVAAGACCAVLLVGHAPRRWAPFALGLASGLCVIFKPNAGVYFVALLVWVACYGERSLRTMIRAAVEAGIGASVFPIVTVVWLWAIGVLPDAKIALIDFNRFYVAEGFDPSTFAVDFIKALWFRARSDPLWLGGAVGTALIAVQVVWHRRVDAFAGLAVLWGAAAALVIALNGNRLFSTYFLQAHPPLALLTAWLFTADVRPRRAQQLAVAAAGLMMAYLLLHKNYAGKVYESLQADVRYVMHRIDPAEYLDRFGGYGNGRGYSARANAEVAEYVRARTKPDDLIYEFGLQSEIYFDADRLPAHRFLRVNEFVPSTFPHPDFQIDAVVRMLAMRRPEYLIFEKVRIASEMGEAVDRLEADPHVDRLLQSYSREAEIEDFTVYRRRPDLSAAPGEAVDSRAAVSIP